MNNNTEKENYTNGQYECAGRFRESNVNESYYLSLLSVKCMYI